MILSAGYCSKKRVFYVGKPHRLVYDEALRLLAEDNNGCLFTSFPVPQPTLPNHTVSPPPVPSLSLFLHTRYPYTPEPNPELRTNKTQERASLETQTPHTPCLMCVWARRISLVYDQALRLLAEDNNGCLCVGAQD
jgi:hypothetical protein